MVNDHESVDDFINKFDLPAVEELEESTKGLARCTAIYYKTLIDENIAEYQAFELTKIYLPSLFGILKPDN